MKKFHSILIVPIVSLAMFACTSTGQISPGAAADIQTALLTVGNVIQQLNTGLRTVAPSAEAILALTHNQGDAASVNDVITQSNAGSAALTTLLANVSTAIQAATSPAAQQAAVSAAVSPQAVSAIVAPIAAATTASTP